MFLHQTTGAFMNWCQAKKLRPKTMKSYEQTIKLFERWLEDDTDVTRLQDIKEEHILAYILDLQQRGKYTFCVDDAAKLTNYPLHRRDYRKAISNTTINNYIRNLKVFFHWLYENEHIIHYPMKRVHALPQERKPKEYLEDDEVKKLLKSMDKSYFSEYRDLLIMMVMLDTGTRLGETLSIENNQLNLAEQNIFLPADKTKGRKARTVFFSNTTAKELRRWLQFKDRYCCSEYLFPVRHNGRMIQNSNYETRFKHYIQRIGIKKQISPHTLRNNFAKRCLLSGMDIYTLSRLLGHSSVSVTEAAYLDIADNELKKRYCQFSPLENIYYAKR